MQIMLIPDHNRKGENKPFSFAAVSELVVIEISFS
jgi:hypothetical protein